MSELDVPVQLLARRAEQDRLVPPASVPLEMAQAKDRQHGSATLF
ncbi:MAG: hypothetical protein ACRD26_20475 [Vicinamibacterales bacterium]